MSCFQAQYKIPVPVHSVLCCIVQGGFAFAFLEGALATALREGAWLLLDEVRL